MENRDKENLGYLAYLVNGLDNAISENENKNMASSWHDNKAADIERRKIAIQCEVNRLLIFGYSDEQINAVKDRKEFTGLRNFNRLSSISYYN